MLLNFCHPCLRPEVTCSTISTEGYDVTNLISGSSQGFLAYSCIKPPINIDLTFICNVQISRVIIWPAVGSQQSSGFQLLAKSTTDAKVPFATLSTAYLTDSQAGVIFYRRDINETLTSVPPGFLQRYMKIQDQQAVNKAINLRLCIVKTKNSVPAIGKIEVWGRVSRHCGRDVIAGVNALWTHEHSPCVALTKKNAKSFPPDDDDDILKKSSTSSLEIPEDFLDPITYEIMVQPIILPSGKIIDQFTLEQHEQNEATWGRSPSDPFTGIPFSNTCRPAVATALKVRIDKFLLENSNVDEIKKLPRTLGRKRVKLRGHNKILDITENIVSNNDKSRNNEAALKPKSNHTTKRKISQTLTKNQHKLPVTVSYPKQSVDLIECKRFKCNEAMEQFAATNNIQSEDNRVHNTNNEIDGDLESNVKSVLSGLKRFVTKESCETLEIPKSCSCCMTTVLYQLPCKHIVCRKVLTTIKLLKCRDCGVSYKTCDPKRIHE